jgi:metallothiol transferase
VETIPSALTLAHLQLDVTDLARSEQFYRDVLMLPVTRRGDTLQVRHGGTLLVLAAGDADLRGTLHFGFRVAVDADVDAWFARLRDRGVPIVEGPTDRGAVYVGRLLDPDGYPVEIYAERSS